MWLVRDATGENRVWKYIQGKEKSVTSFKKAQGLEISLWSSGLTARGLSLIPGQGTKIPQAEQYSEKQTNKNTKILNLWKKRKVFQTMCKVAQNIKMRDVSTRHNLLIKVT